MAKNWKIPHTFTIVFVIVVLCAILTWIIPGGEYQRETVTIGNETKEVVAADSYHQVDRQPQTWQIFTAFYEGFKKSAHIIVFILMIGGAFWIMNGTKAIDTGILSFLNFTQKLQRYKFFQKIGVHNLVIILIMLLFSSFGAIFGMSEETLAFMVIFVPLAVSMGYDSLVGVLMCYAAAHVGFAGALFNPFTIGIAQGLSGLQPFSGIGYRLVCWGILTFLVIAFTLIYAARVKKNPQKSMMYEADAYWRERTIQQAEITHQPSSRSTWVVYGAISILLLFLAIRYPETTISIGNRDSQLILFPIITAIFIPLGFYAAWKSVHNFILMLLFLTIITLVTGVLGYGWYVGEIAALFFVMGLASGFAYNVRFDQIIRQFLDGCKDIMNAALIVGMAGGIIVILQDGKIIDTILHGASQLMADSRKETAVGGMYLIQNLLNLIIPSGSAKAALTIPMMAEFSDLIGLSRQINVLAFQFGDGFTNMITPTSGVLIGALGIARVPYAKWFKFIFPFILFLIIIGFLLLLPTIYIPLTGF